MGKAPLEDFLIRSALQRSFRKLIVIHSEKSRATSVEMGRILDTGKILRAAIFPRPLAGSCPAFEQNK